MLLTHVLGGGLAIVSGFVALYAAKGATLHRRSGIVFVYSMIVMATTAVAMAASYAEWGNLIAGALAGYLVVTALTTVRPPTVGSRRLDIALMLFGSAVGVAGVALGVGALAFGGGTIDGSPAAVFLVFGIVALASSGADLRAIRSGGARGARRVARHLWRMCFALFVASASFFLGQADEIPEPLRILPLLAVPAFLPLLVIPYWLWRVRIRRSLGGIGGRGAAEGVLHDPPRRA